ncbi:MAG: hypothetical protein ACYCZR_11860 [Burkholderiales bacterium]
MIALPYTIEDERADYLTRTLSAFDSFYDLINAKGNYRPTLYTGTECPSQQSILAKELADLYDKTMEEAGDSRRVFRHHANY